MFNKILFNNEKQVFGTDGIRGTVNKGNITGENFKFGLASVPT